MQRGGDVLPESSKKQEETQRRRDRQHEVVCSACLSVTFTTAGNVSLRYQRLLHSTCITNETCMDITPVWYCSVVQLKTKGWRHCSITIVGPEQGCYSIVQLQGRTGKEENRMWELSSRQTLMKSSLGFTKKEGCNQALNVKRLSDPITEGLRFVSERGEEPC